MIARVFDFFFHRIDGINISTRELITIDVEYNKENIIMLYNLNSIICLEYQEFNSISDQIVSLKWTYINSSKNLENKYQLL